MDSFQLDRLDPLALEATLAYLRANPEPSVQDAALFTYRGPNNNANNGCLPTLLSESRKSTFTRKPVRTSVQLPMRQQSETNVEYYNDEGQGFHHVDPAPDNGAIMSSEVAALPNIPPALENTSRCPIPPHCTWAFCDESFISNSVREAHLDAHKDEVLIRTAYPTRCLWQGCKSKAVFRIKSAYLNHLQNIHTRPILCYKIRCSFKNPFRNKSELQRHIRTVHDDKREFECPFDTCEAQVKTFARHDKLLQHIRETIHRDDAFCPYYHCSISSDLGSARVPFTNRQQIATHFNSTHALDSAGGYSCELGSCGDVPHYDHWTKYQLRDHLSVEHSLHYVWHQLPDLGDMKAFRDEHVDASHIGKWHQCASCEREG